MRTFTILSILAATAISANAATPHNFRVTSSRANALKMQSAPTAALRDSHRHTLPLRKSAAPQKKMAKAPITTETPTKWVTELPAGVESKIMTKEGIGYVYTWFGIMSQSSEGSYVEVAVDGSDVYMKHVWAFCQSDGYMVGKMEGNKVSFDLPQLIQIITYDFGDDGVYQFNDYAVAAEEYEVEDPDGNYNSFKPAADQTVTFTIQEDGSWTNDNPDIFIGEFDCYPDEAEDDDPASAWQWVGGGDYIYSLIPFDKTSPEVPDDVSMIPWVKVADNFGYNAELGFSDDKCYLRGVFAGSGFDYDNLMMVGDVDGNKITFPSGQYLGVSEDIGYVLFFEAGRIGDDPDSPWIPEKGMVFDYDADKNLLTPADDEVIGLLLPTETFSEMYCDMFADAYFMKQQLDTPVTGIQAPYNGDYAEEDGTYPTQIGFYFSNLSENDVLLDIDRLYYQVLIDGDPLELDPYDYPALEEPVDEVPIYAEYDYFMFAYANSVTFPIYIAGYDEIAVRLIYKADDASEPIYSEPTLIYSTDGVKAADSKSIVSTTYIDLHGRSLSKPSAGICIRADKMDDGSVKYAKVVIK